MLDCLIATGEPRRRREGVEYPRCEQFKIEMLGSVEDNFITFESKETDSAMVIQVE